MEGAKVRGPRWAGSRGFTGRGGGFPSPTHPFPPALPPTFDILTEILFSRNSTVLPIVPSLISGLVPLSSRSDSFLIAMAHPHLLAATVMACTAALAMSRGLVDHPVVADSVTYLDGTWQVRDRDRISELLLYARSRDAHRSWASGRARAVPDDISGRARGRWGGKSGTGRYAGLHRGLARGAAGSAVCRGASF